MDNVSCFKAGMISNRTVQSVIEKIKYAQTLGGTPLWKIMRFIVALSLTDEPGRAALISDLWARVRYSVSLFAVYWRKPLLVSAGCGGRAMAAFPGRGGVIVALNALMGAAPCCGRA